MAREGSQVASVVLSDDEWDELAELLEGVSRFGVDGVLGLLHAVAVAPGTIPFGAWISAVLADGLPDSDDHAGRLVELLVLLEREVRDALGNGEAIVPEPEEDAACEAFAAGYVAAAELDPEWTGDPDRWTLASRVAYLAGRDDLVPEATRLELAADADAKPTLRRQLAAIVDAARAAFHSLRRAAPPTTRGTLRSGSGPIGRNAPCPCGSRKRYKRCCGKSA